MNFQTILMPKNLVTEKLVPWNDSYPNYARFSIKNSTYTCIWNNLKFYRNLLKLKFFLVFEQNYVFNNYSLVPRQVH